MAVEGIGGNPSPVTRLVRVFEPLTGRGAVRNAAQASRRPVLQELRVDAQLRQIARRNHPSNFGRP